MDEDQRRRFLTQTVEVPPELMKQLSTDAGVEGLKVMLEENGWDRKATVGLMCHALDEPGKIDGSKWMILVSANQRNLNFLQESIYA